jgi:hypothetical protein
MLVLCSFYARSMLVLCNKLIAFKTKFQFNLEKQKQQDESMTIFNSIQQRTIRHIISFKILKSIEAIFYAKPFKVQAFGRKILLHSRAE